MALVEGESLMACSREVRLPRWLSPHGSSSLEGLGAHQEVFIHRD